MAESKTQWNNHVSILSLPTEALLCISTYLECKDIVLLGVSCRQMLSFSRNELIWRRRIVGEKEISTTKLRNEYLKDLACEQEKHESDTLWWILYKRASSVYSFGKPAARMMMTFSNDRRVLQSKFNLFESKDLSIEMWIKSYLKKPDGVVLGCQSSQHSLNDWPHYHWQICHIGPDGCIRGAILPYTLLLGPGVDDGQWHHIALTSSQNMQCLYVDGNLADKAEKDYDSEFDRHRMNYLQLGTGCISYGRYTPYDEQAKPRNFQGYYPYHGHVRDLRFWKKCLAASEIKERKNIQRIDIYLEKYDSDELSNLCFYWPLSKLVNGSWPWQASVCGKATLNLKKSSEGSSTFDFVPIQ